MTTTETARGLDKGNGGAGARPPGDEARERERATGLVVGTQMRELERRYVRSEERLLKEFSNLRAEITSRMDALERHVRGETEALVARLAQETQDRQKDLDGARQAVAKNERELRQAILDTSKTLSTELHRVHDGFTSDLSREVHDLEDGKVARSSLAAMLSDVVVRLNAGLDGGGAKLG